MYCTFWRNWLAFPFHLFGKFNISGTGNKTSCPRISVPYLQVHQVYWIEVITDGNFYYWLLIKVGSSLSQLLFNQSLPWLELHLDAVCAFSPFYKKSQMVSYYCLSDYSLTLCQVKSLHIQNNNYCNGMQKHKYKYKI